MDLVGEEGGPESRSIILTVFAVVAFGWYCILWSVSILGCLTGRKRYRVRPRSPLSSAPASNVPGVSILRPLKGLDTNLFENLESTFTQDYPNYELLLCVADADDQALGVVHDLLQKYPRVDAKIIIGEDIVGVNPKVNNLIRSYRQAKHDILWVLDSNVLVVPGTLARSVDALVGPPSRPGEAPQNKNKRRIGLVHHVPCAFVSEPALGSQVEEAFLNTNHAKMYLAINSIAIESCVVGKSNMYRRSDVDRVTAELKPLRPDSESDAPSRPKGLTVFGRYLAEDNMIAAALWHELGLRHELSCDVAGNAVGNMSLAAYIWRRVRWIRVRKRMVLAATLAEPFTECVVMSSLGAWPACRLWGVPPWLVLLLHYPAWIALDLDVYESLVGHYLLPEKRWRFLTAWLLREFLALPIWMFAVFGDEVEWRGKRYRILKNGETEQASPRRSWWSAIFSNRNAKDGYERLDRDVNP